MAVLTTSLPAQAFTDHYYSTFDTNRPALAGLYQESSLLTFEGQKTQGAQAIIQKLQGLPFQACKHHVDSLDAQPSPSGGMNIFVTGRLQVPLSGACMLHCGTDHVCSQAGWTDVTSPLVLSCLVLSCLVLSCLACCLCVAAVS